MSAREPDAREGSAGPVPEAGDRVRSFVAVLLPDGLRARVEAAAAALRRRASGVSWVRVENLHLTLRFLGAIDEATRDRAQAALAEAAGASGPFSVTLGGFGAFPSPRAARVFWVGLLAGSAPLAALHARVEQALAARGVPPEGRPFHAHVTLGRARDPRGLRGLDDALGAAPAPIGETRVEAVHLMRSDLHPAGVRYSVLARLPLTGEGARV
jgi:2'-5' RNA ligase